MQISRSADDSHPPGIISILGERAWFGSVTNTKDMEI